MVSSIAAVAKSGWVLPCRRLEINPSCGQFGSQTNVGFMRVANLLCAIVAALALAYPATARFARVPAAQVDEVPIERLLANLQRNAQGLSPEQRWRAIGRVHLLAYVRQAKRLPAYRREPGFVAEGKIGDCAEMDLGAIGAPTNQPFPVRRPGDLCEAHSYGFDYRPEVPAGSLDRPRMRDDNLQAALDAYLRAKVLAPDNFRTRLALAFAFDRLGRMNEARAELRTVVIAGLQKVIVASTYDSGATAVEPPPILDNEARDVFAEAVDHMLRVAVDSADRRNANFLKHRLKLLLPTLIVTPILVPIAADTAFEDLVDRRSRVKFDFTGQGPPRRMGWLTPKAAWLVWDPKRRGKITSGFQLFGSVTWLAFWDNGYHALGSLDDNGDGQIAGRELEGLALWRDRNGNGVSERGEVRPVRSYQIVSLSHAHERVRDNLWISDAGVTFASGETRPTYDWVVRPAPVVVGSKR
jgi:hypothetical protein